MLKNFFKEREEMNPMNGSNDLEKKEKQKVSLNELAELTGFPVGMIKDELNLKKDQDIDLEELRQVLSQYLDRAFVLDEKAI
jgi:hypothetical protein